MVKFEEQKSVSKLWGNISFQIYHNVSSCLFFGYLGKWENLVCNQNSIIYLRAEPPAEFSKWLAISKYHCLKTWYCQLRQKSNMKHKNSL